MNLRRSLTLLAFAIAATLGVHPHVASAACASSMPYTFTNVSGTYSTVDANTTNSNNTFLLACAKNVDNTQIGTAGIYANQIIPLTVGEATFGGSVAYTFPSYVQFESSGTPTTGVGIAAGSAAGGVNCSAYDVFDILSPFTTYSCWDTSGDFGVAANVSATGSITAEQATSTSSVSLGAAGSAGPGVDNSGDAGLNFDVLSTSTLGWRWLAYTGGTPTAEMSLSPTGALTGLASISVPTFTSTSSFSATGASIYFGTNASTNTQFNLGANSCGAFGYSIVNVNASATANSVNMGAFGINCNGGKFALDSSGDIGATGNASFAGQIQGSDTAAGTQSYVPPLYSAAGGAAGIKTHTIFATCTTNASTPSTCTITLSGQGSFTSASTYACGASDTSGGGSTTGSNPSSGTSVVLTDSIASRAMAVVCTGYYYPRALRLRHLGVWR